ncbi:MAG: glycosyltransferase family 4 protein [Solirubrobacteraceae bacterium]
MLFITGRVPAYRAGALERLHQREGIEVALFGGRLRHGGAEQPADLPFPHLSIAPHELLALASSGRHRAVVCSTAGRLAPLAGWAGARRAGLPLILWASLWSHPRTLAHALGYLPLRRLYRSADAVVTYGPHVSAYVSARGARNIHIAPQSVDNDFWRAAGVPAARIGGGADEGATRFLFVGRAAPEKGLEVLMQAWGEAAPNATGCTLALVGGGGGGVPVQRTVPLGALAPEALREVYAACHVLVVPSIPTPTFREPWGLVVNEAMNRGLAVIASDAVGAAAGGLVRDGVNGLVVPAGDPHALARAIERLAGDRQLRARMGEAGAADVLAYSHEAWAAGFSSALSSLGVSRGHW